MHQSKRKKDSDRNTERKSIKRPAGGNMNNMRMPYPPPQRGGMPMRGGRGGVRMGGRFGGGYPFGGMPFGGEPPFWVNMINDDFFIMNVKFSLKPKPD